MQIRLKITQIFKNTQKRPSKIFAAKPLRKTAKFSQFDLINANFSTLRVRTYRLYKLI